MQSGDVVLRAAREERRELETRLPKRKQQWRKEKNRFLPGPGPLHPNLRPLAEAMNIGGCFSRIATGLWLGNRCVPVERLQAAGIRLVVHVGTAQRYPDGAFEYVHVGISDGSEARLLGWFPDIGDRIHRHRAAGDAVFVHCQMGHSRSPTLVIAYLVSHLGLTLREALELVQLRRPVSNPNTHFKLDLLRHELRIHGRNSLAMDANGREFILPVAVDQ